MILIEKSNGNVITKGKKITLLSDRVIVDNETYFSGLNELTAAVSEECFPEGNANWWKKIGTTFELTDIGIAEKKKDILTKLDAKSLEVELQGVMVDGIEIMSDRESVSRISSAATLMNRNTTASIYIEAKNGWHSATKMVINSIEDALWNHIASTAVIKKSHHDAITSLVTSSEVLDYDIHTGW